MADSPTDRKSKARGVRKRSCPQTRSNLASVQTDTHKLRSTHQVDEQLYALESDLSDGMEVSDRELDAIAQLLGDELEQILSDVGRF